MRREIGRKKLMLFINPGQVSLQERTGENGKLNLTLLRERPKPKGGSEPGKRKKAPEHRPTEANGNRPESGAGPRKKDVECRGRLILRNWNATREAKKNLALSG